MGRRTRTLAALLYVFDILFSILALYLADWLRHELPFGSGSGRNLTWIGAQHYLAVWAIWTFAFQLFRVYQPRRMFSTADELRSLLPSVLLCFILLFAYLFVFKVEFLSRLLFLYFLLMNLIALIVTRLMLRLTLKSSQQLGLRRQLLIVGAGPVGRRVAEMLGPRSWIGFSTVGYVDDDLSLAGAEFDGVPVLGTGDEMASIISDYTVSDVILALPWRAHDRVVELISAAENMPVRVHVVPDIFSTMSVRARAEDFWGIPLIGIREPTIDGFDRAVKRAFDLLIGGIATVITAPLLILVAIAILIDDGWPVFFTQQRVGENGRLFWIFKFRTMRQDTSGTDLGRYSGRVYKHVDDQRITRFGRVLRRSSIDELPNLWNVLRGEMSLVGPRPELPWVVEEYEAWQRPRLSVPPGMTGWWQIQGRSEAPLRENVELDLYYIQNYSPVLDLQILCRTVWVVLSGRGAY